MLTRPAVAHQLKQKPQAIGLFAGVGDLDIGMTSAGFEIALALEGNQHQANQYANCVIIGQSLILRKLQEVDDGFDAFKRVLLEPAEFCQKWLKNIKPGERGYYKACVKVLAKVTGLSERTIEGWGPDFSGRPDSVVVTLRKEDILNQIRELVKPDDLSDLLGS